MDVRYHTKKLQKTCLNDREMKKNFALPVVKSLKLRLHELEQADNLEELRLFPGRWEPLTADRQGTWSGRLSANWRVIISPEGEGIPAKITVVCVEEIVDYHNK